MRSWKVQLPAVGLLALVLALTACQEGDPVARGAEEPPVTPAQTAVGSSEPGEPSGPMLVIVPEIQIDRGAVCVSRGDIELDGVDLYQADLPFDEAACRETERFFDVRMALLGAGGQMVPTHTARLAPGSRIVAPFGGQISFRKMQSDLPDGYHLYGAGALRIQIVPRDPSGASVPHNPVIHLYVPGGSTPANAFADLPRESAGATVERGEAIIAALGSGLLDPEGAHDHNLILFFGADGTFINLFDPEATDFLAGGAPGVR